MSIKLTMPLVASFLLASCGGDDPSPETRDPGKNATGIEALDREPADVQGVLAIKEVGKVGDAVAVYGRVREFTEGYASFILTDRAMKHCAEREGDSCPTPWDYCCESPTDVVRHSLTVEFREDDKPIRVNLEGQQGLKKLADVVVSGVIVDASDGNVVVAADGFFVRS